MGKVISITETRGCSGKTLMGLNLALAFSGQIKEKVAFIDLSFCGARTVETVLGFEPGKTVESLISIRGNSESALLKGFLPEYKSRIALLEGMPLESKKNINVDEMQNAVKMLSSVYPFVIICLPEDYDGHLQSLLNVSDVVVLSLMPQIMSLRQSLEFINLIKSWHLPLNILKLVVNTVVSQYSLEKKKIEDILGLNVFSEIPYDVEGAVSSLNNGIPNLISSPTGNISRGVNCLAKQILELKLDYNVQINPGMQTFKERASTIHTKTDDGSEKRAGNVLKQKLHKQLVDELSAQRISIKNFTESPEKIQEIRQLARIIMQDKLAKVGSELTRINRAAIVDEMLDEVFGLGCIEVLLRDPEITEIMVNGPFDIYFEKSGRLFFTDLNFSSIEQLMSVIDRIVSPLGRRIDESSPLVDARLADGSRVNVVIPPLSLVGPTITIRKFSKNKLTAGDLIKFGALKENMAEFLRICVQMRKNIVVSGGTGSGKTTLLNVISAFIPENERIVTIEDSAELNLPQKHVIRLESRPPSIEGAGEVSIRRLVINALRMRPDRIVVGECRAGETLDMLQAMNTGHDGSLTTIHSNSPRDGVSRISTMVMMAGIALPEKAIREQIASAVHIIVQLSRLSDGSRKIVEISEITGIDNEIVKLVPIFKFHQTGLNDGNVEGRFISTGNIPSFINEIASHGLAIDKSIFSGKEL